MFRKRKLKALVWIAIIMVAGMASRFCNNDTLSMDFDSRNASNGAFPVSTQSHHHTRRIKVFSTYSKRPNAVKQRQDIAMVNDSFEHVVLNKRQQRAFLESSSPICGDVAVRRFDRLLNSSQPHLASQVWSYCALYVNGGLILDSSSVLMVQLDALLQKHAIQNVSMGVLHDVQIFPNSMYGSFLYLPQPHSSISEGMLNLLVNSTIKHLHKRPLLLPQMLYNLVQKELVDDTIQSGYNQLQNWHFLEQKCIVNLLRSSRNVSRCVAVLLGLNGAAHITSHFLYRVYTSAVYPCSRIQYQCPVESGYCCHIYDRELAAIVATTRHSLLPSLMLPSWDRLVKPYNQSGTYDIEDLPFISTVREKQLPLLIAHRSFPSNTTSAYDILSKRNCLPSIDCIYCLRTAYEANACTVCRKNCTCYCKTMCKIQISPKPIGPTFRITPPVYRRDPTRLIPRIVHQTWFEAMDADKYPHTSRFVESFKQSGWEHRFYTDDAAAAFLTTHFPPEVKQAYDALLPGAFQADLFRYCVLLIHGGLYADVDILLESNLDAAIGPDVGFVAPIDCLVRSWRNEKTHMCADE